MLLALSFVCGYLIGSVPTAYLLVKKKAGIDIRESGSGNVGGFNAFRVTESKSVGYTVGILDGIKGLTAVLLSGYILSDSFWIKGVALLGSVVGHNYPLWLKFKGGRGLATACGGLFLIGVSYIAIWCTLWVLLYQLWHDILRANIVCTIVTPLLILVLPGSLVYATMVSSATAEQYLLFTGSLSLILLISHRDEVRNILRSKGN